MSPPDGGQSSCSTSHPRGPGCPRRRTSSSTPSTISTATSPPATRRQILGAAALALGGAGALTLADRAEAQSQLPNSRLNDVPNTPENIVNIAATAEVLATILNTVGAERVALEPTVRLNVRAAAREELIHFQVLTSSAVGARPATTRIWIPDAYFASPQGFLTALAVGDQVFINAYLIAVTSSAGAAGCAAASPPATPRSSWARRRYTGPSPSGPSRGWRRTRDASPTTGCS